MVYVHFARPSNNTKLGKIQLDLGLKEEVSSEYVTLGGCANLKIVKQ